MVVAGVWFTDIIRDSTFWSDAVNILLLADRLSKKFQPFLWGSNRVFFPMKKDPLVLCNTRGVSGFHDASLTLLLISTGALSTRITASGLETNSVTKTMLWKDSKQKTHAMVTGSYNKDFLHTTTHLNYPQTRTRCHSLPCHLEMLAWKWSLLSQRLAGISMEHKQMLLNWGVQSGTESRLFYESCREEGWS